MKREARIEVRVTPAELTILKQASDNAGATLSSWVRMVLFRNTRPVDAITSPRQQ